MQVVYGNKYNVVIFVIKFYCLLHRIAAGNTHQSTEFSNAVVYVYNVVACAELTQLFQRQCSLSASCAVAAQTVIVETSEQLMVCEKGYAQGVVYESCVYGFIDGSECYFVATFGEDAFQAFGLTRVIGEQHYLVAFADVLFEFVACKVKVFVEKRLHTCVETDTCALFAASLRGMNLPASCRFYVSFNFGTGHKFGHFRQFLLG